MLCSLHQGKSTPLGVPIIPGLNAQVQAFLDRSESNFVAPRKAYQITDFMSAIYVQMVFGLKTSSVKCISAGFCPTVLTAFNHLAQEWEQMANDVRNATLKPSLNLTKSQRITLEEALGDGDPQRADQLVEIMSESAKCSFKSVAYQLWPNLTRITAVAGGSFAIYVPQIQHYLSDKIHIASPVYICSEGPFGVNKWPVSRVSAYSLLTSIVFFEFIPLADADNTQPSTLLADEIKVGEVYEIVVTTSGGLYCYRNGDLIKVLEEGDASEPPVIDVLGRKSLVLSI
jgi:auxin responsive GH3 family protein